MGTQGSGGRVFGVAQCGPRAAWQSPPRWFNKHPFWLSGLLCLAMLWAGFAHAQSTNYVYDAAGRVVAVTQSNGTSAQYTYDALGHLAQTNTLASGQLAIFAFIPTHGEAGTQVTIEGQGFSSTLANNSVMFNGTAATVLSASATQLVTTVPSGATTGPISVAVGGNGAVSAVPFVVDGTGLPPVISQVAPIVVNAGATVTVTGTQLDPITGGTSVTVGGTVIQPTTLSNNQFQLAATSSGYIGVQTPFGAATSAQPLIVLPSGVAASNVTSSGYETPNGTPVTLNLGTTSQVGTLMVQATPGAWVSLLTTGISPSTSSIAYTVYAPNNVQIMQGSVSISAPSIHLPQLMMGGTYTVVFQSNTASTQLTVASTVDAALAMSAPNTVATTSASQSQRVLFQAEAGQTLALAVTNVAMSSPGNNVMYTVYAPDGSTYISGGSTSSSGINLSNLSLAGTYQLVLGVQTNITFTSQVELLPGVSGNQPTNGTAQTYSSLGFGQNIYVSFAATEGQNLELTLNNISQIGGTSNGLYVSVYSVAGVGVTSGWCYSYGPASCRFALWNLPAGNYTSIVEAYYGGLLSFNASIQPDVIGPSLTAGTPTNINLAAGQVERLTFTGTAGSTVAIGLSGMTTVPAGQTIYVSVYRPDTGVITTTNYYAQATNSTNPTALNLPNLPVNGTYTVIMSTSGAVPATAQMTLVAGVTGIQGIDGTSEGYTDNIPGQNAYLTFTALQGKNLELTLNDISITSNGYATVNVTNAVGGYVAGGSCIPSSTNSSCTFSLWNLPAGTYTVTVTPSPTSTMQFNAIVAPDLIGPVLAAGTPTNVSLGAGQVERLTFTGTVGSTVALQLSNISTTPPGQTVLIKVYRPDTSLITTANYYAYTSAYNGPSVLNLPNLPASGTYTVVVYTYYGFPATAQLTLASGVTGTLPTNGTAESYATMLPGQNAYFSFSATQGQNLELSFNNIAGSSDAFSVTVNNSSGTYVTSFNCSNSSPGASCVEPLWNLAAGTYSVLIAPYVGNTVQFNALLQPDVIGPVLALGSPASVNLGAGQAERFGFNANLGDTVALQVSGLGTVPSGQNLCVSVYRSDVGLITSGNFYLQSCSSSSASTINLPNLPAAGTYTVVASSPYGNAEAAQLTLTSDVAGSPPTYGTATLPDTGTLQSEQSSAAGQPVTMTFNANQGQNLELTLNNIVVTGTSNTGFAVSVNNAAGQQMAGYDCYQSNPGSSCRQALWNLAAGTYTVVATPATGGVLQFSAMIQPDTVGPSLTVGTPATVALVAGQVERLTFNGTLGQTVALDLSSISTTPSGQAVYINIYRPDGGLIGPNNYYVYTSSMGRASTLNLPNLPATGTYTVVAYNLYGLPATAQISLANGVTGTQPTNGTSESYATAVTGQNVYFTFTATQGQNLELMVSGIAATSDAPTVTVYNSSGAYVSQTTCFASYPGGSCVQSLWNLPAGVYSVVATPYQNGILQFNASIQPDIVGPALAIGTPTTVNLAAGQTERLTFPANQGDTVALQLSGVSTVPAGQYVQVNVYRPDTGLITTSNNYTYTNSTGGAATLNLPNLPASGDYTVVIFPPNYGLPTTAQLTLVSGVMGTQPTNGTSQSYATSEAKQNVYFTFTATQGQNLELSLNSANTIPDVSVYNAAGTNIATLNCGYSATAAVCMQPLWNLQAGTYSVIVSPWYNSTIQFNATLQPDIVGPAISATAPALINLSMGQAERVTFPGTQEGSVALQLSGVSTTPSGQSVFVNVYRPDGGLITPTGYYAQTTSTGGTVMLNLPNLPAGGAYTAVAYTLAGTPATAQLSVVPSTGGSVNGSLGQFMASGADQTVNLTFNATVGQNLELTLNNINAAGASTNGFEVLVTNPSGTPVADFFCYAATPGASCSHSLWNVSTGNYSVVATPIAGGTISFDAIVQPDLSGSALVSGTPSNISLSAGQVERVQFAGTAGGTATLQLASVSTTPTSQNVYVSIYRPDVGIIQTNNSYTSFQATSSGSVTLSNLPVTGNYTAIITTSTGIPATAQLTYATQ